MTRRRSHQSRRRVMAWHNPCTVLRKTLEGFPATWSPCSNEYRRLRSSEDSVSDALCSNQYPGNLTAFVVQRREASTLSTAGCCFHRKIRIWDWEYYKEERALTGHGWDVKSVEWHPHKSLVVSGSKDNLIKLWDPRTGNSLSTLYPHKNTVNKVDTNRPFSLNTLYPHKNTANKVYTSTPDSLSTLYDRWHKITGDKVDKTTRFSRCLLGVMLWCPVVSLSSRDQTWCSCPTALCFRTRRTGQSHVYCHSEISAPAGARACAHLQGRFTRIVHRRCTSEDCLSGVEGITWGAIAFAAAIDDLAAQLQRQH